MILDLGGFYHLVDSSKLLSTPTGVCQKLVDLEPRVLVAGQSYAAARVGEKVYIEGEALEQLGVRRDFDLLLPNDTLSHDIVTKSGKFLLARGNELSERTVKTLRALSMAGELSGPVEVMRMVGSGGEWQVSP